ncbi:MAG: hypothetical protein Ct9H90mP15_01820 [Candidatus Neomarinimicrobiota bacterium]|nr:MAG: hypothetical protein Ct9H90mP15_01820 [Candidatus Neomarinimicrobiota bacterium]
MKPKSFAIWANVGKKEVPTLVSSVAEWATNNNLELFLPNTLEGLDFTEDKCTLYSSEDLPNVDFCVVFRRGWNFAFCSTSF